MTRSMSPFRILSGGWLLKSCCQRPHRAGLLKFGKEARGWLIEESGIVFLSKRISNIDASFRRKFKSNMPGSVCLTFTSRRSAKIRRKFLADGQLLKEFLKKTLLAYFLHNRSNLSRRSCPINL